MDINQVEKQMQEVIEHLKQDFSKIRTGRANPAMLNGVKTQAYGNLTPINQVAIISVAEARQLTVKPFDPSLLKEIEIAINNADLGINPTNDGEIIRLNIPQLTQETRKLKIKDLKIVSENHKIKIRNIRQDANTKIKKEQNLPDDEKKQIEKNIQNLTDQYNRNIDDLTKKKEQEVMTI